MRTRPLLLSIPFFLLAAACGPDGPASLVPGASRSHAGLDGITDGETGPAPTGCEEIEICGNGVDDNCNDLSDCADPDCAGDGACGTTCSGGEFEVCGNGSDDDCDGAADCADADCAGHETCVQRCETTEGNGCNGDPGYGDRCAPEDNENGCSPERFDAWCNRRNADREGAWDGYLSGWVDARCDGDVSLGEGQYPDWSCTDSSGITYLCRTPLVLKLDAAAPVRVHAWAPGSSFDFSSEQDGRGTAHDWPTAATPWLVHDVDGDGRITSARELLGSATLVNGVPALNGFQALSALDANRDGSVDARDPAFASLRAWMDDGDRVTEPGELVELGRMGIRALPTTYTREPRCDARGNCEVETAPMTFTDPSGRARTGALVDLHLKAQDKGALLACLY